MQGRDTGYRIGSNRRQNPVGNINPRIIIIGVVGILILIALVFGISSCVKGCSPSKDKKGSSETTEKVNPDDSRVAFGVSSEETAKLSAVLDRNETFAKIAKNANKIKDERLIDLAIAEPAAIDFVAGAIKADGSTQPYSEAVPQGEYPKLYTFDARWGYSAYAEGTVGSWGSGPLSLSMASMGLSGKTTYDPATVAQAVKSLKLDNGTTGMDDAFVTNHAADAGLSITTLEVSSDGMYNPIAEGMPLLVKLKADSGVGSNYAHWILVTVLNSDNSITINDPTSVEASSHAWSFGGIVSRADAAYSLSAAAGTGGATPSTTTDPYATDDGTYDESYDDGTGYDDGSGYDDGTYDDGSGY